MAVSVTNQSKTSASLTNQALGDGSDTWDEAEYIWDSPDAAASTWDRQTTGVTNNAKTSASLTNQAKS